MWNIKTEEEISEIEFSNSKFKVTAIIHPATYLNKVLLGSEQGSLQLWNLKSRAAIYKFKGWDSAVRCLAQRDGALHVVAVGLESGQIVIHNIEFDECVFRMSQSQDWGAVTGIAFRTDGPAIMVSASRAGHLAIWDLKERKLASQCREAHADEVTGMASMQGLLLTSSPDNTLKQVREKRPTCVIQLIHLSRTIVGL